MKKFETNLPAVAETIRVPAAAPIFDAEYEPQPAHVPLAHYLWILRRHGWKIAGFVAGTVLATLIVSLRLTPVYESTVTVDIDRQMPTGVLGQEAAQNTANDADQFLATQVKIIQSDSVLRPVVDKFHLREVEKDALEEAIDRQTLGHTIVAGRLAGALIQTSWHDYPGAILGTTERPLLRWFSANVKRGETWLDVGAHYGYTAIALSRLVGESGRVFAFEPVVSTAGCVARTRDLNGLEQLTVVPLALGNEPDLRILKLPATRGMADSTLSGTHPTETICVISLDALWPSLGGSHTPIHGIKIDVQGMERQVVAGMREALCRFSPKLIIEFHRGVDRREILGLLASVGYSDQFEPVDDRAAAVCSPTTSATFFARRADAHHYPYDKLSPRIDRHREVHHGDVRMAGRAGS